jgi:ketosteroid isomerase-like protein
MTDDAFRVRQAVQERLVDYWWDVDANDASESAGFYTEDCVYLMCGHRMEGRAAVADYYGYRASRGARLVRHVLTNLRARLQPDGEATVQGVLTVYAADGVPVLPSAPPILVADNSATFVRGADGAWRMRLHTIEALFRGGVEVLVPPAR